MKQGLSTAQSKGLADFFFGVAKGVSVGGIGVTAISSDSFVTWVIGLVSSGIITMICIRAALGILQGVE